MAAERMNTVEKRMSDLEALVGGMGAQISAIQETILGLGGSVDKVTAFSTQLGEDMAKYSMNLDVEKRTFSAEIDSEFDKHKAALATVVNEARNEILTIKTGVADLYGNTAQAFQDVKAKVELLEGEIRSKDSTGGYKTKGFLPMKSMVPAVFGSAEEDWRKWQEDVADYMDTLRPSMRNLLKAAEKDAGPIDDSWVQSQSGVHPPEVLGDMVNVFRALKALTQGEARTVVQAVRDENGFAAWKHLHQRFGLSVAAKQGKVMCDLAQMVQRPAKTPAETRTLITELERRIRIAEDVTGNTLDDGHAKSILASILDPTTRAHTSTYQGVSSKYQDLKRAVLEFANNNTLTAKSDADAMNIGQLAGEEPQWEDVSNNAQAWDVASDVLSAVSAHTQCHQCAGFGHLAHQCPTPKGGKGAKGSKGGKGGKGSEQMGKGGQKGAKGSKGGQKGGKKGPMYGGCWTCGGPHFASECPSLGKGKGSGKGFNAVAQPMEQWPTLAEQQVRPLCSFRIAKVPIAVQNKYALLEDSDNDDEGDEEAPTAPRLADYVMEKRSQRQRKQLQMQIRQQQAQQKERSALSKPSGVQVGVGNIRPLVTIEPEGLRPVSEQPEWEVLDLAVDSGASETVIPEEAVKSVRIKPSEASRRGVKYEVANGEQIPNLGEKAFNGITDSEGLTRGVTAQVCDVNKPLLSVNRLVQAGNTVVFSPSGSYVEDGHTHERMWLRESGGMFMLKLWVPKSGF